MYPPLKKKKTKLAAPSGAQADLKELQKQMPTECGWVQGYFKTFTAKNKRPYLLGGRQNLKLWRCTCP
jgi:hypothetical protein